MTQYCPTCTDVRDYTPDEDGISTLPRCACLATAAAKYSRSHAYDPLTLGFDVARVAGLVEESTEPEVRQALLLEWGVPDPQTESEALVSRGQLEMFKENA